MKKIFKYIPGLRFLMFILLAAIAILLSLIMGLFELIIDQNERGKKIDKYDKGMTERIFLTGDICGARKKKKFNRSWV